MPPCAPPMACICQNCPRTLRTPLLPFPPHSISLRTLLTSPPPPPSFETGHFRKDIQEHLKSSHKTRHSLKHHAFPANYAVTCGLEIHAQLHSSQKLFSSAATCAPAAPPNTHIAPFDASLPGTQPRLNKSALLPALRAALALDCTINPVSGFDRKHYHYWDQPAGYQITQFYSALANDGHITIYPHDSTHVPAEGVRVPIRQVQLEQDTGKTIASANVSLVDLNRVGAGLVEIITAPFEVPGVEFAAAVMRKIQATLRCAQACVVGMEWGGLRADVNVSVRGSGEEGLGRRCEIKNLSSLKSVEEAISAEVRRQVDILEGGGEVLGETRAWDVEGACTRRLRGKEGEVDYRYMPDPDLPPLVLGKEVVESVRAGLPMLPDEVLAELSGVKYCLTVKDAKTLMALDEERGEGNAGLIAYYKDVVKKVIAALPNSTESPKKGREPGRLVGNWLLHELGGTLTTHDLPWPRNPLSTTTLSSLIIHLLSGKITNPTAKSLLPKLFSPTETRTVEQIVEQEGLAVRALSDGELEGLVRGVVMSDDARAVDMRKQIRKWEAKGEKGEKKKAGLSRWFIGKVMKEVGGRVPAERVEETVVRVLREDE